MNKEISIFVLMPFEEPFTSRYRKYIEKPLKKKGYNISRADDIFRPNSIIDDIRELITSSDIIIAELTGKNPNVFYELGIAHQLKKYVILICQQKEDVPFDLKHIRTIFYEPTEKGYSKLLNYILKNIINFVINDGINENGYEIYQKDMDEVINKILTDKLKSPSNFILQTDFPYLLNISKLLIMQLDPEILSEKMKLKKKDGFKLSTKLLLAYEAGNRIKKFLKNACLLREDYEKEHLLNLIISNLPTVLRGKYYLEYFNLIYDLLDNLNIKEILKKRIFIEKLIDSFISSSTIQQSLIGSKLLLQFTDNLTSEDVNRIFKACFAYPEIFFAEEMKERMDQLYHIRRWELYDYIKNKYYSFMSK